MPPKKREQRNEPALPFDVTPGKETWVVVDL